MFEVAQYSPLLHTRRSELRGYRELPDSTKDLILPLFVVRPLPNAKSIDLSLERIVEATGGRSFGVDLESEYPSASPGKPAQAEFDLLRNPDDAFSAYFEKLSAIDGAVPVLQLTGGAENLTEQVAKIHDIGRGGFVRVRQNDSILVESILTAIAETPANELAIFIDAGWARDVLLQSSWALNVAQVFFSQMPERPIVICGSSFPSEFTNIVGYREYGVNERLLFNQVRANLNANFIYGDWGSTRPPSYDQSIKRTIPRIDVAELNDWPVYKAQKFLRTDDFGNVVSQWETYAEVAERLVSGAHWDSVPLVWGRYAIEVTADNLPTAIKDPQAAAAARINIHLHVQAHSNTPELLNQTDDPYED